MPKNKIKFGLKNVHRADVISDETGVVTYGTPVKMEGAVTLTLDPSINSTPVPADDLPDFATLDENNGYTGSMEFTNLSDEDRIAILGEKLDDNGVLVESADDQPKPQAYLFEISGDKYKIRHVLYNVRGSKPSAGSATGKTQNQSDVVSITARPAVDTLKIKAKVENKQATADIYEGWFEEVYVPVFDDGALVDY